MPVRASFVVSLVRTSVFDPLEMGFALFLADMMVVHCCVLV